MKHESDMKNNLPTLQHGFFRLSDHEIYEGYYDPADLWNGWAKVHLLKPETERLVNITNDYPNSELRYEWRGDILVHLSNNGHTYENDIAATLFRADDKILLGYEFGVVGYCWMPVKTWEWNYDDLKTPDDVVRWFKALMFLDGLNFHPDTPFAHYVTYNEDPDQLPFYTGAQAEFMDELMEHCFGVPLLGDPDIYELAIQADREYREYFGMPVPGVESDAKDVDTFFKEWPIMKLAEFPKVFTTSDPKEIEILKAFNFPDAIEMDADKVPFVTHMGRHYKLTALANHIISMADDAYLSGHPEWVAIVEEAKAAIK